MSYVSTVMLSVETSEEVTLAQINMAIEQDGQQFNSLTEGPISELWGGLKKYPEATLYGAAFNYLRLDELKDALAALPWRYPENVQLFVQEQNDERFAVFMLSGKKWRELA